MRMFLIVFMALTLTLSILPPQTVEAKDVVLIKRGANYELYDNGKGQYLWVSAPQWVYNGESWEPYIFKDRYVTDGYYQVQSSLIGARIYDYYAEFYDPNMTEVRVYDERWEVESWKTTGQGKWDSIGAQSGTPTYTISQDTSSINITKTFNSWAGTLEIKYVFNEHLKHEITWTSTIAEETEFRVLQQWSGIVGEKVKHEKGTDIITDDRIIESSWFEFQKADGSLSVYENQLASYENLQPVEITTRAKGMKADFIFGIWVLTQGESLSIDPDTSTLYPDVDSYVSQYAPNSNYGSATDLQTILQVGYTRNAWIKIDLTSIPHGSNITNAELYLYCYSLGSSTTVLANNCTDDSWSEMLITWNNEPTVGATINSTTVSAIGWFAWNLTSWIQDQLDIDRTASVVMTKGDAVHAYFYSSDYPGPSLRPYLTVTYDAPNIPVNEACDSTPIFSRDVYGWVNVTVSDLDGLDNLTVVQMRVNTTTDQTFAINWTQNTGVFAEVDDADNICTPGTSLNVTQDANTTLLSFNFSMGDPAVPGACDVNVTSTDNLNSISDFFADEFSYAAYVYDIWLNDYSGHYVDGTLYTYNRNTTELVATSLFDGSFTQVYLLPGEVYYFEVANGGYLFRSEAWQPSATDLSHMITILDIPLAPLTEWNYVVWSAGRSGNHCIATVEFRGASDGSIRTFNATNNLMDWQNYTGVTGINYVWTGALGNTTYWVVLNASVPGLSGQFQEVRVAGQVPMLPSQNQTIVLPFFTSGMIDPGIFSLFLLFGVTFIFSTYNRVIGLVIATTFLVVFNFFGWLNINMNLIAIVVLATILYAFKFKGGEKET